MAYVRIRPRRSTAEEWEYNNPILAEGEMGIEVPPTGVGTGTVQVKFGDGVTAWKDLPYGLSIKAFEQMIQGLKESTIIMDNEDRVPTEEIIEENESHCLYRFLLPYQGFPPRGGAAAGPDRQRKPERQDRTGRHLLHGQMSAGRVRHGGRGILFRFAGSRLYVLRERNQSKGISYAELFDTEKI